MNKTLFLVHKRKSKEYKALKKALEDYIASIVPEKGSPLDSAIKYYKNMNDEQWTYLKDGTVTLDNNEAERVLEITGYLKLVSKNTQRCVQ